MNKKNQVQKSGKLGVNANILSKKIDINELSESRVLKRNTGGINEKFD